MQGKVCSGLMPATPGDPCCIADVRSGWCACMESDEARSRDSPCRPDATHYSDAHALRYR